MKAIATVNKHFWYMFSYTSLASYQMQLEEKNLSIYGKIVQVFLIPHKLSPRLKSPSSPFHPYHRTAFSHFSKTPGQCFIPTEGKHKKFSGWLLPASLVWSPPVVQTQKCSIELSWAQHHWVLDWNKSIPPSYCWYELVFQ